MNKKELIKSMATKADLTNKSAAAALDATIAVISDVLKAGENIQLMGFGTFEVKTHPARTSRNPRTGEAVAVPEKRVPTFKPGKALKDAIK